MVSLGKEVGTKKQRLAGEEKLLLSNLDEDLPAGVASIWEGLGFPTP